MHVSGILATRNSSLDSLNRELQSNPEPADQVQLYSEVADYYMYYYGDEHVSDSLHLEGIRLAESTFKNDLILKAHKNWLSSLKYGYDHQDPDASIQRVENLLINTGGEREKLESWIVISNALIQNRQMERAHQYAVNAFSLASGMDDESKIISQLALGRSFDHLGKAKEAYQSFLNAYIATDYLDDEEQKKKFKFELYEQLFQFLKRAKSYDKAAEYKNQQIELLKSISPVDSNKLMMMELDLLSLAIAARRYGVVESKLERILDYEQRNPFPRLKSSAIGYFRNYMNEAGRIDLYRKLYIDLFPEELTRLEQEDYGLYCRVMGILCESEGDNDSADYYYRLAETEVMKRGNDILLSNYYSRYGEFYLRHGNYDKAIPLLKQSYELANKSNYLKYMLESSRLLDSAYFSKGDFEQAYKYASIHNKLEKQEEEYARADELIKLELEAKEKQYEIAQEKYAEEKKRKHNLQYFLITVGIIILFFILIIASSAAVPEWVIKMLSFFNFRLIFEFIILLLDHEIHHWTHGEPLLIFLIKILIMSFLFPLHHFFEETVTHYLVQNRLLQRPSHRAIRGFFEKLWPWLKKA